MIELLTYNLSNLSEADRDSIFTMITQYADVIDKVAPDLPLIKYIKTGEKGDSELFNIYDQWKLKN